MELVYTQKPNHLTVHCTVYSVHCTLYTIQCTLYTVQCTVILQCTLYSVQCTVYTIHSRMLFLDKHRYSNHGNDVVCKCVIVSVRVLNMDVMSRVVMSRGTGCLDIESPNRYIYFDVCSYIVDALQIPPPPSYTIRTTYSILRTLYDVQYTYNLHFAHA